MARRWAFGLAALISAFGLAERAWERFAESTLRLTFFDVGQGDGALVEFPGGEAWLVDAGGGEPGNDRGRRVVLPELTRSGILHLGAGVLSHPHQDHAEGFMGLFGEVSFDRFLFGGGYLGDQALDRLRRAARQAHAEAVPVEGQSLVRVPGGTARFTALNVGPKVHDRTLLVELAFAGCRVLLAGDAEADGERAWLSSRGPGRIDLLKVGHHGSLTSSSEALLNATTPRWAVISVGLGNGYGHPRARVMERFRSRGISVFRTDFHGYVKFRVSSTGEVACETALGACGAARCQPNSN